MTITTDTKKTATVNLTKEEIKAFRIAKKVVERLMTTLEDNEDGFATEDNYITYDELETTSNTLDFLPDFDNVVVDIMTK